ncbi:MULTISPECIES: hypothetical protein [unclassified Cyanobium]|uniref:hypothetical protein n=1 Tax=unclassified Cyanobium TaxID=2627006 RepID=UPI0020CBE243|nr:MULTISPECIES: hypothetical protein [unclassified Cyanobium]MCP9857517.1 hypothetical protein [Cyanobium sp. Cruz-8H5]MCP9864911.1 hypothetical protein [Cyanobium sp. Cruz-8D1]
MKASLPFPGWRRLQLPLLVALALNGLPLLTALRPSQRPVPSRATAPADDTPELLRFSRQQAREPALPLLTPLSLGSLSSLPPPPPTDLPAGRRGNAASTARPQARAATTPGRGERTAQERPPSSSGAEPTAVSRLLALALQAKAIEASEATSVAGLWEQASPTKESPAGMSLTADGLEWRRLPLAKARAAGLPLGDPLAVLFGGRVLLLWPEGTALWMLGAAGESQAASSSP